MRGIFYGSEESLLTVASDGGVIRGAMIFFPGLVWWPRWCLCACRGMRGEISCVQGCDMCVSVPDGESMLGMPDGMCE